MLQIKTIMQDDPDVFDGHVNAALLEGWHLERRYYSPNPHFHFCAELERVVIAPHERNCDNCLYSAQDGGEPCDSCEQVDGMPNHWEPEVGAIVMVPLSKREEADTP